MTAPTKRHRRRFTPTQRNDAVNTVLSRLEEFGSIYKTCEALSPELGIGKESLRRWVLSAQEGGNNVVAKPVVVHINPGDRKLVRELEDRIRHLEEINQALKLTSAMFARDYHTV